MDELAFISYANEDYRFASITHRLLEFHFVNTWMAPVNLNSGDRWKKGIEDALRQSSSMVLIGSQHSAHSSWVQHEVTRFETHGASRKIHVLRLDDVDVGAISPILHSRQVLDFRMDYGAGFEHLIESYCGPGSFLVRPDRRDSMSDRRQGERRKPSDDGDGDRRKASTQERLQFGLKKAVSTAGIDTSQPFPKSMLEALTLTKCMEQELERYTFKDRLSRTERPVHEIRSQVTAKVQDVFANGPMPTIEEALSQFASQATKDFEVKQLERRTDEDRRKKDRRESNS